MTYMYMYMYSPPDILPLSDPGMGEQVQRALSQKGVREALSDKQVQQLLCFLKQDPSKAQQSVKSHTFTLMFRINSISLPPSLFLLFFCLKQYVEASEVVYSSPLFNSLILSSLPLGLV